MVFAKVLLGLNSLAFLGYGLVCLFMPELPASSAGMELPNVSATNEVVAMYGGLQIGIGVLLLYCMLRNELVESGLLLMALLIGSLAVARALGMIIHGPSEYNIGALGFEATTTVLSLIAWKLLGRASADAGAPA